MTYFRN